MRLLVSILALSMGSSGLAAGAATGVSLDEFGAAGDGTTDDHLAIQRALATGQTVRCRSGATYATEGGLVATTPGQVIEFTGCTIKLLRTSEKHGLLRLSGAGVRVFGGSWDLNAAEGVQGDRSAGGYDVFAISAEGDAQRIEGVYVHDSSGLCLKAQAATRLTIRGNRFEQCRSMAIYAEGSPQADSTDLAIDGNQVSFEGFPAGTQGIGVYSAGSHRIRRVRVSDNTVLGPTAHASATSVAITVRGAESVIHGNIVRGSTIGISVDQSTSQDCAITGNNIAGANGDAGYGIEINGGRCAIANNFIEGGNDGIVGSVAPGQSHSLDGLVVLGNVVSGQLRRGVYFYAPPGTSAQRLVVASNLITSASARSAVYLQGDCRHSLITGNILQGPGSTARASRAVFLDGVPSDIRIQGNRVSGWARAVALYAARPTALDRIIFDENDVSADMPSRVDLLLSLEGPTRYGVGVRVSNNVGADSRDVWSDHFDVARGLSYRIVDLDVEPEGLVSAGAGSLLVSPRSTHGGPMWVKEVGAGATGWRSVLGLSGFQSRPALSIRGAACAPDERIRVDGAMAGATCATGMPESTPPGIQATCFVPEPNAVTLRICNVGSQTRLVPAGRFPVRVFN